jgi:putative flippase GtrA
MAINSAFVSSEFVRFVAASGTSAIFNFLSRILFSAVVSYPAAIVAAYGIGMAVAYTLNRKFVFSQRKAPNVGEVGRFVIVNFIGVLQTLAVSLLMVEIILPFLGINGYREEIGHFIGLSTLAFTSYLGHKYWTFRK